MLNFGEGFCGPLHLMSLFYNMEMGSNMKNFDLSMYIGLVVPFINTRSVLCDKLNAFTFIVRQFCEVVRLQLAVSFKKVSCDTVTIQNMQSLPVSLVSEEAFLKEPV